MYGEVFIASWKQLRHHPILILPDILFLAVSVVLSVFLLSLLDFPLFTDVDAVQQAVQNLLLDIPVLLQVIASLLVFLVVMFFVGSGLRCVKYVMVCQVLRRKPVSFSVALSEAGSYLWHVVALRLLVYSVYITGFLLLGVFIGILTLLSVRIASSLGIITGVILFLILGVGFLFRYPIQFLTEKRATFALRQSLTFGKRHTPVVIWSILLIAVVNLAFNMIVQLIALLTSNSSVTAGLAILLGLIPKLWSELYLFGIYHTVTSVRSP